MFNHDHHRTILSILKYLNKDLLEQTNSHFGGGTLLSLMFDEYRWSQDIDFICPIQQGGYRILRSEIHRAGYDALFLKDYPFTLPREIQANQYGIRFPVMADGHTIKFEIVAEARIQLDPPENLEWCPVPCLSLADCFSEKLLANSDRWNDRSILSRDLIDLSFLRIHFDIPEKAIEKAEHAYEVKISLRKAIQDFQENPSYRNKCFETLQIDRCNIVRVIDGLDLLANDLNLPLTERASDELKEDPLIPF